MQSPPRPRARLFSLAVVFSLCTLALVGRLAQLQLVQQRQYDVLAAAEHDGEEVEPAHRGPILDRNGFPLALSETVYDLRINRDALSDQAVAQQVAQTVGAILGTPASSILATVHNSAAPIALIASNVPYETGRALAAMHLTGVDLDQSSQRQHPEGDLASSVLGFVGVNGEGLEGVELAANATLAGKAGLSTFQQDAFGRPIGDTISDWTAPRPGASVTLTIDRGIQAVAEQDLDDSITKSGATGGTVIAMDPQTGAVLAMASRPSFRETQLNFSDPNEARLFRDRAVTDLYEPGSTFKLITMAAALDSGLVNANTTYLDTGTFQVGPVAIHNWDNSAHGVTTMTTVIVDSLNTGAAWVSRLLGAQRFYDYVGRFGFGKPTGIELAGEAAGQIRTPDDPQWSPVDLATNSYGQGLGATPLQMIAAVAAIVNGGKLMRPYIVKEVDGPHGATVTEPKVVTQVISAQTAETVRQMMQSELQAYTLAQVPGYTGGGKSGTAYIAAANGYASERTIPSYMEFAPYDNPKILLLVKLDNLDTNALGGVLAAPLARDILEQALPLLGVAPSTSSNKKPSGPG